MILNKYIFRFVYSIYDVFENKPGYIFTALTLLERDAHVAKLIIRLWYVSGCGIKSLCCTQPSILFIEGSNE